MPCDTIQTSEIDLGKIGDWSLMQKALEEMGYRVTKNAEGLLFGNGRNGGKLYLDGRCELQGAATELSVNEIKRAYSTEAVKLASAKFGWKLAQTSDRKFVAQRRF